MVRIQNGIVVRVDDLLPGAGLYFLRIAGGGKFLKLRRIAAVIGGPVAADGVQHNKRVFVHCF